MGGEWEFRIVNTGSSTIDLKRYQARLLQIRNRFQSWLRPSYRVQVTWSKFYKPNAKDANVFAKFRYACTRQFFCHRDRIGCDGKGTWTLFWDPTLVPDGDLCSDLHAKCSPLTKFSEPCFEIQKILAKEFPKHFQLYLGDGIDGKNSRGRTCDQYWGVPPNSHFIQSPTDGSWNADMNFCSDSDDDD